MFICGIGASINFWLLLFTLNLLFSFCLSFLFLKIINNVTPIPINSNSPTPDPIPTHNQILLFGLFLPSTKFVSLIGVFVIIPFIIRPFDTSVILSLITLFLYDGTSLIWQPT